MAIIAIVIIFQIHMIIFHYCSYYHYYHFTITISFTNAVSFIVILIGIIVMILWLSPFLSMLSSRYLRDKLHHSVSIKILFGNC